MGGTLAMYLSERYPDLAGMILINAAIELPKMTTYYESKKDKAERFVPGIASDIKNPHVTELAYDKTPVKSYASSVTRSEEHTSELQSRGQLVCRLLLETKRRSTQSNKNSSS